jgi:arsenate reductase
MVDEREVGLRFFSLAMKRVLFVCVHNSGRSQMAEAFFNQIAKSKVEAISAGTQPAAQVNPTVVVAMRELGIEIGNQKPKSLTLDMLESAYLVITMGCSVAEVCPASFVPTEDWELDDPEGKSIEEVRRIRDRIKTKVKVLVEELDTT